MDEARVAVEAGQIPEDLVERAVLRDDVHHVPHLALQLGEDGWDGRVRFGVLVREGLRGERSERVLVGQGNGVEAPAEERERALRTRRRARDALAEGAVDGAPVGGDRDVVRVEASGNEPRDAPFGDDRDGVGAAQRHEERVVVWTEGQAVGARSAQGCCRGSGGPLPTAMRETTAKRARSTTTTSALFEPAT